MVALLTRYRQKYGLTRQQHHRAALDYFCFSKRQIARRAAIPAKFEMLLGLYTLVRRLHNMSIPSRITGT